MCVCIYRDELTWRVHIYICVCVCVCVCVYKTGSGTRLRVANTTASEQGSTFTNNEASDRGGAIFARGIRTFDIEEAEFTVRHDLYVCECWVYTDNMSQ